ncbi:MAG: hypothetical protein IJ735_02570 [Clostridia bacterium]|nr:hypothetical protein [Clostridia bacterium]
MNVTQEEVRAYVRRLIVSRTRLLVKSGFFGLLLMNATFALDETLTTAATDGEKIYFSPTFLSGLTDEQLDFVVLHEVMHMALSHCKRGETFDQRLFNIACDIVVNSTIFRSMPGLSTVRVCGEEPMRLTPDGREGADFTAEEVYAMFLSDGQKKKGSREKTRGSKGKGDPGAGTSGSDGQRSSGDRQKGSGEGVREEASDMDDGQFDSHAKWREEDDSRENADLWRKRVADAAEAVLIRDPTNSQGDVPAFAARVLRDLKDPQTDWRTVLNDFLSEERVDYTFFPPDRRTDGPFFLPDFNEFDVTATDVLFMIDASASMSDEMLTEAYSEVKGAIDRFGGRLNGLLGFFDAAVTEPKPFCNEEDFLKIKPYGGGGTSFFPVFEWARKYAEDHPLVGIVVLTDGYAPFPDESISGGIPTVWVVNNEVRTPPWGRVTRIKSGIGSEKPK